MRITKNTNKIVSIMLSTKEDLPDKFNKQSEIDSFVIIPGVTKYNHIYSTSNWLIFDSDDSYIGVLFQNDSDLDRFFTMLMRDIKLNNLINIETKKN